MSDRTFERAVRDWLEDGSDRTPRAAIDGVLLAVKTTPQERDLRIPRRFTLMPNYLRLAAALAVVAVAVIGVSSMSYLGGGSVTPSPTATPAPTSPATLPPTAAPTPVAFTSPLYRYGVTVPGGWVITAATFPWPEGATFTTSYVDLFAGPPGGVSFDDVYVASQFVPLGMDPADWVLRHEQQQAASGRDCKGPVEDWTQEQVGALDIRRLDLECQGTVLSDVAFVVENRGYAMSGNPEAIATFLTTFRHGEFFGIPRPTLAPAEPS